MPWWAPLAIVGGALAGAAVGALLVLGTPAGAGDRGRRKQRLSYEETDTTSYVRWNPVAFLVIGGLVALIVGLAIGLSVG